MNKLMMAPEDKIVKTKHGNTCACGAKRSYDEKHDTYFCDACNWWLEAMCSDNSCEYCAARSERPL